MRRVAQDGDGDPPAPRPGEQCCGAEGVLFEEVVGAGDLDGGGAFAAEEDGLAGAAGR
ncbi:hypothetical protein ABTZ03_30230 [Kitasatospora sp. NPDC096077]|uniref:hypothetical protein n=1 Tax=Kitasatospora sp. NPDC096077 TaxID=3155544 RepID=UPI0033290363